ncbi:MAG TPA: polyhydroxyalkanoate synthesis regulator DNA-binding domain-containing protein, partial [Anaerolineae bacterium]|nr:polyhydroxyalkanoate synthesis regulator DNA-binding domain-containing protein [Anaerolineae bacterium]
SPPTACMVRNPVPLIKRYPNRKLYDTEARQYITLDIVADLIRRGHEVTVLDHVTGHDLTAVTLTQIILEEEKKRDGFLPAALLAGLVRAGGKTAEALRRALAAPLDLAHQVDEEIERRLLALASGGDLTEEEAYRLRAQLLPLPSHQPALPAEAEIEQALLRLDLPTHADLEALERELERLEAALAKTARS